MFCGCLTDDEDMQLPVELLKAKSSTGGPLTSTQCNKKPRKTIDAVSTAVRDSRPEPLYDEGT